MIVTHRFVRTLRLFAICAAWSITSSGSFQAAESKPDYLSDALADRITSSQAWGELGLNKAAKPTNGQATKLRIGDRDYEHGLGHHANGEIVVSLDGQYKTFECDIGVQWQGGKNLASVVFQVFVDDKKLFESGPVRENDPPQRISIPVEGADTLRLVANDAGDGITCDCADWADARLTADPAAKQRAVQTAVDIAPFARVVTSDPKRTNGTAASRVQEIPAEDIFLDTDLQPAADGNYTVPVAVDGFGCIGLRWNEMRLLRRLELHWADATAMPSADAVQLQYWVGASPWQGEWKPLPAKCEQLPGVWSWQIANKDQPAGTYRLRWVFPASNEPIVLKRLSALSRSSWTTADLRVELQQRMAGKQTQVIVTNGNLLGPAEQEVALTRMWDSSKPAELKVRYSKPRPHKSDRTVLRFELPGQAISVAVEDVVARGCVYVPSTGLFVTTNPSNTTLAMYLQQIAGKKTVLEDVRQQPDQTLSQAMAKTHHPIQENGPTQVSLACDNRKFIVERDGTIRFTNYDAPDGEYPKLVSRGEWWWSYESTPYSYHQLVPKFGGGKGEVSRHLDGGWLPKPVTSVMENGIKYQQCTYVAPIDEKSSDDRPSWYRHRAVCVADFTIENTRATEAEVSLCLTLSASDGKKTIFDGFQEVKNGLLAVSGDRVVAFVDAGQSTPLKLAKQPNDIGITGKLAAGASTRLVVYLPAWPVKPAEYAVLSSPTRWGEQIDRFWKDQFAGAMQIDIPDPLSANVIRASQVHCMVAARNEERGSRVAPWIASMVYGPLESEAQAVIRGMDMCGHSDFARRGLEFFLKRYNDQGFLTTGYTMVGTGENLWTLAEYQARRDDREWLTKVAPQLVRACKWIVAQRAKTKGLDADGHHLPESGLMPPGVTADWERYAYRFYNDAQYCHGLEMVARDLAAIGHPDAPSLLAEAKQYREDLLRAYQWTQARCPVVPLGNGTWVTNHPAMLDVFGNVEEMVPAEDGNRSWCYSVEIGSHHLAANRLLDPNSAEVARMMDYLEDHQFLRTGHQDYPEEQNRKDIFALGGFSKVQPYYSRNAELCAMRDDVKPFVRSYFNALSSLLNSENLSLWEHFNNTGGWNKTHETGWFLCQTAILFAAERGDELWLAPFVTNNWLKDGMTVAVRNQPTRFGPIAYNIVSHVDKGYIEASIEPPTRNLPKAIVIRIRHPEGKPMQSVTVNGKPHAEFDPTTDTVRLAPGAGAQTLRVEYSNADESQQRNVQVEAAELDERIIYHSPATPGYTAWVGLWQLPNGTIQCDFRQQTGPKDKLNVIYAVVQSNDGAQTWNRTVNDVPEGYCRGMAVLPDGTMVRVSWSGPGSVQRSIDGGKTWGDPIRFPPTEQYRSRPTVIRPLRDGRLVLFAGCWKQGAPEHELVKTMFVSSDQGKTWGPPIVLMSPEEGLNEESDFCELPNGDLLWIHRAEHYPGKIVPVPPLAYHEPGSAKTPAEFYYTDRWQSIARKTGDTFLPERPTSLPFAHSGFPCVLMTSEGVILHLATGESHWSADQGKTWNVLMTGDKALGTHYYPRAIQMADGRILCIGHRGSDDIYGTVDQAIIQQMFRLKIEGLASQTEPTANTGLQSIQEKDPPFRALRNAERVIAAKGEGYFPVMIKLRDGMLVAVMRAGAAHLGRGGRLDVIRSIDGGRTWSEPVVAVDGPWDDRNPALGQMPDGTLVLAYAEAQCYRSDGTFDLAAGPFLPFLVTSSDGGRTWSPRSPLSAPWQNASPYGKITVSKDGTAMISLYRIPSDGVAIVRSSDNGRTWGDPSILPGGDETQVIELPDARLMAFSRMEGDGGNGLLLSESDDHGRTWVRSRRLLKPQQWPFDATMLQSGRLLLSYGSRLNQFGAGVTLSKDLGDTWDPDHSVLLGWDSLSFDTGYPSTVQLDDGTIVTMYYAVGTQTLPGAQAIVVRYTEQQLTDTMSPKEQAHESVD